LFNRLLNTDIKGDKLVKFVFTNDNIRGDESILQGMIPKIDDMVIRISRVNHFYFEGNVFKVLCTVNIQREEGVNKRQYNIDAVCHFNLKMKLFTVLEVFTND
jgi:hypothetical protein